MRRVNKTEIIYPLLGVIIFLLLWQAVASWLVGREWLLPTPTAVATALAANLPLLLRHSLVTLAEAEAGMALAVLLSILVAWLLSLSAAVRKTIYPLLLASQMVPIIVLAPLFIIWFGYGVLPKILVVVLICFFPATINILAGLNDSDAEMLAFYRVLGMNNRQLLLLVRLPQALPYFFSGLRIAAVYSVMGAVIGEWLGAQAGLGLLLVRAQQSFDLPLAFAAIVAIIIWSTFVFLLVVVIERRALSWQKYLDSEKWQA
jgi:ABC-type nitrate/sulfonate/bicarbonate transport system permease component